MIRRTRLLLGLSVLLVAGGAQAATSPWFGVWKLRLERPGQTAETLVYSDAGGGAMRMESVEDKGVVVTRFDGRPAAGAGPAGGQGWSLAIKAASPTRYTWTLARGGKDRAQGVNTLSADLKTFEEVSWAVGKPGKTITLTYERK